MISIYITVQSTTLGNRSYLFRSNRLPLKSMKQPLSMDNLKLPQYSGGYILTFTKENTAPNFYKFSIFFHLDFLKLHLLPKLHCQSTFHHLIKNLPVIYKQRREENTIKKYQQYLNNLERVGSARKVFFLPAELMYAALQQTHRFYTIKFFT